MGQIKNIKLHIVTDIKVLENELKIMYRNIALIGSSGAIGNALLTQLSYTQPNATINAFSRRHQQKELKNVNYHQIDYDDEASIAEAALKSSESRKLDLILVATGTLHSDVGMPEKALRYI